MKNVGKIFEDDFKNSLPDYIIYTRLRDAPQSFNRTARFSWKNPCDNILFDDKRRLFYSIELKTTKGTSFSFEDIRLDNQDDKMIHKHQIIGLANYAKWNNVRSGFILNFRDEKKNEQRTYYIDIKSFIEMTMTINKRSFNESDLLLSNPIRINGVKKRTRYVWDLDELFDNLKGEE